MNSNSKMSHCAILSKNIWLKKLGFDRAKLFEPHLEKSLRYDTVPTPSHYQHNAVTLGVCIKFFLHSVEYTFKYLLDD